jgi:hypothetical protein
MNHNNNNRRRRTFRELHVIEENNPPVAEALVDDANNNANPQSADASAPPSLMENAFFSFFPSMMGFQGILRKMNEYSSIISIFYSILSETGVLENKIQGIKNTLLHVVTSDKTYVVLLEKLDNCHKQYAENMMKSIQLKGSIALMASDGCFHLGFPLLFSFLYLMMTISLGAEKILNSYWIVFYLLFAFLTTYRFVKSFLKEVYFTSFFKIGNLALFIMDMMIHTKLLPPQYQESSIIILGFVTILFLLSNVLTKFNSPHKIWHIYRAHMMVLIWSVVFPNYLLHFGNFMAISVLIFFISSKFHRLVWKASYVDDIICPNDKKNTFHYQNLLKNVSRYLPLMSIPSFVFFVASCLFSYNLPYVLFSPTSQLVQEFVPFLKLERNSLTEIDHLFIQFYFICILLGLRFTYEILRKQKKALFFLNILKMCMLIMFLPHFIQQNLFAGYYIFRLFGSFLFINIIFFYFSCSIAADVTIQIASQIKLPSYFIKTNENVIQMLTPDNQIKEYNDENGVYKKDFLISSLAGEPWWKGVWDKNTTYKQDDIVYYQGYFYELKINQNKTNLPPGKAYCDWEMTKLNYIWTMSDRKLERMNQFNKGDSFYLPILRYIVYIWLFNHFVYFLYSNASFFSQLTNQN